MGSMKTGRRTERGRELGGATIRITRVPDGRSGGGRRVGGGRSGLHLVRRHGRHLVFLRVGLSGLRQTNSGWVFLWARFNEHWQRTGADVGVSLLKVVCTNSTSNFQGLHQGGPAP
ncbi:hypothetical protein KC19_10G074500 [Ceratodon purpureus]|uniref:Uncharacterized protein n=1 Tax=Ceratodon purpureus TaxID=3225 RepID=A0A8T0GHU6_CERPU|nr:hypothetical protein KC19_10G074500 [Ceratodon purpureus]